MMLEKGVSAMAGQHSLPQEHIIIANKPWFKFHGNMLINLEHPC